MRSALPAAAAVALAIPAAASAEITKVPVTPCPVQSTATVSGLSVDGLQRLSSNGTFGGKLSFTIRAGGSGSGGRLGIADIRIIDMVNGLHVFQQLATTNDCSRVTIPLADFVRIGDYGPLRSRPYAVVVRLEQQFAQPMYSLSNLYGAFWSY
jgi:hypothetical protein